MFVFFRGAWGTLEGDSGSTVYMPHDVHDPEAADRNIK